MSPDQQKMLNRLVDACLKRGTRPIPLPHCAICARYANENLAFEGILALLDALPEVEAHDVVEHIEDALADLPAGYRQQLVTADNFGAQLEAPSWRLVRGLLVDLYSEGIEEYFADSRLAKLEQITLLGGAYGGPDISVEFIRAIVESPVFGNVRKFYIHSGDVSEDGIQLFCSSEFTERLDEIVDFPCRDGRQFNRILNARIIRGLSCWDSVDKRLRFPTVALPATSPWLEELALFIGWQSEDGIASFLTSAMPELARLKSATVSLGGVTRDKIQDLMDLELPSSVLAVTWRPETKHRSILIHDCEYLNVRQISPHLGRNYRSCDALMNPFPWPSSSTPVTRKSCLRQNHQSLLRLG
ncbi:MAG: hypothetical protein JWM11_1907 [Planctomycetaceae bacterium]|nr:hypothetical protein [Planctomycetaceae bacterium]